MTSTEQPRSKFVNELTREDSSNRQRGMRQTCSPPWAARCPWLLPWSRPWGRATSSSKASHCSPPCQPPLRHCRKAEPPGRRSTARGTTSLNRRHIPRLASNLMWQHQLESPPPSEACLQPPVTRSRGCTTGGRVEGRPAASGARGCAARVSAFQFCSKGLRLKSLSRQLFCNLSTFNVAHPSHAVKVEPDMLSMTIPKTYMWPNCSCIARRQVVDVRETRHIIYEEF
jgi:hypothetical protein